MKRAPKDGSTKQLQRVAVTQLLTQTREYRWFRRYEVSPDANMVSTLLYLTGYSRPYQLDAMRLQPCMVQVQFEAL